MKLCVLAFLGMLPLRAQDAPHAVVGVDVLTMESAAVLRDQTVVVHDGVIVALGPRDLVRVPDGARVIDGAQRTLLPGLFDTHVHLNDSEPVEHLVLYLANGVTTVQSMHGTPRHLAVRERLRRGELVGPRLLTTGPTTATEGVDTPEKAERVVREQKAAGYDAIKMYGDGNDSMSRETYARLIATARAEGLRVTGHAPRNLPFSVVLAEGQDSIDHMEEITYTAEGILAVIQPLIDLQFGRTSVDAAGDALAGLRDYRAELAPAARELALAAKAAGLAVTPTLIAFETIWRQTTPEYKALLAAPEMRYVSPLTRLQWGPARNRYRTGGWRDKLELMSGVLARGLEIQQSLVKAFHEAGVPILCGSDAPLTFVYPGFGTHRELALLVGAGLSPYEALRAATSVPARELGLDAAVGTVAVGKEADLLLVEGDPLADIDAAARVAGVFARGRFFDRAELDERLAALAALHQALEAPLAKLVGHLDAKAVEAAAAVYGELDATPELAAFVEDEINAIGYEHLGADDVQRAIAVFELNTRLFPAAYNAWDSLGEARMTAGDDEQAVRYYEKSLELNAGNANAERMLERLRARRER